MSFGTVGALAITLSEADAVVSVDWPHAGRARTLIAITIAKRWRTLRRHKRGLSNSGNEFDMGNSATGIEIFNQRGRIGRSILIQFSTW